MFKYNPVHYSGIVIPAVAMDQSGSNLEIKFRPMGQLLVFFQIHFYTILNFGYTRKSQGTSILNKGRSTGFSEY